MRPNKSGIQYLQVGKAISGDVAIITFLLFSVLALIAALFLCVRRLPRIGQQAQSGHQSLGFPDWWRDELLR